MGNMQIVACFRLAIFSISHDSLPRTFHFSFSKFIISSSRSPHIPFPISFSHCPLAPCFLCPGLLFYPGYSPFPFPVPISSGLGCKSRNRSSESAGPLLEHLELCCIILSNGCRFIRCVTLCRFGGL